MAKRDIEQRYRGSLLGMVWSFLIPLFTLAVYTFVFSVLFRARWAAEGTESRADFALITFCGLIYFNIFSETVSRAPSVVVANVNYVKKIVFPVEVLPLSTVTAALTQGALSFVVLALSMIVLRHSLPVTMLLAPIALLPIILLSAGFALFLASLGVFLRDIAHAVSVITPLLMFLSAVLYPVAALPEKIRSYAYLNPLIGMLENFRGCVVMGTGLDWSSWGISMALAGFVCVLGYAWFMKTRPWFADVI